MHPTYKRELSETLIEELEDKHVGTIENRQQGGGGVNADACFRVQREVGCDVMCDLGTSLSFYFHGCLQNDTFYMNIATAVARRQQHAKRSHTKLQTEGALCSR